VAEVVAWSQRRYKSMGRRIEKTYEHGTHIAEFVDEIPPLGEDRKTIFLPDADVDKMVALGGRTLGVMLASIMRPLAEKFGDEVWEMAKQAMYQVGRRRAASLARLMKINDPKDARCLGRIMDIEDNNSGVKGEWIETGKKRAVKREYECPLVCPQLEQCPQVCSTLLEAMEEGTFDKLGVRVKKPLITKVIPSGNPYCEVVVELEE